MPEPKQLNDVSVDEAVNLAQGESELVGSSPETPDEMIEADSEPYVWQASEYVHHHKTVTWYVWLGVAMAALLAVAFIFKQWFSVGVFLAMGAAILVYAHRAPRVLTYELNSKGIVIGGKVYLYASFRSFGVVSEEEWHAIDLEPTQRFMPRLTVLFGDEDFDVIVEYLSRHLPRVDRNPDLIERISRYVRF